LKLIKVDNSVIASTHPFYGCVIVVVGQKLV